MKFYTSIDLYQNELKQARIYNVGTFPSTPVTGQIFYNTTNGVMYYYSGSVTAWVPMYGGIKNVLAGHGLVRTATANTGYGDTITLDVNPGPGLEVSGAYVQLKNAANLSDGIIPKWNGTAFQFEDSIAKQLTGVIYITGGLQSNYWQADLLASTTAGVGKLRWNDQEGTLEFGLKGGNVNLQVGQEEVIRVVNKTGSNLLESEYKVVRVRTAAEGGAQGQRLAIRLAQANTKAGHTGVLGLVTENINNNQEGFITSFGNVSNVNTTGSLQGETWADGDTLWLSETVSGGLTKIEPATHPVQIGYVVYAHSNNGKIFVRVSEGVDEIKELHDVNISSPANGDFLVYNSTLQIWENKVVNTGVNGTGIANYVARWLDTDTLTTGVLYDNGTNVGIGTTNPTTKLQVTSGSASLYIEPSNQRIESSTSEIRLFANNQNIFRGLDNWTGTWSDAAVTTYFQTGRSNGNTAFSSFVGNLFNRVAFLTTRFQIANIVTNITPPVNYFQVDYNNSNLFSITDAGNVGIGTTGPSQKLHVSGTIRQTGVTSALVKADANGDLLAATAGTDYQAPITNPVTGTGVATRVAFWNSTSALSSSSNLYWDNTNSRLGIGTTAPSEALHVTGRIRVTTVDNGTGDFLTVSATGVITDRTAAQVLTDISAAPASGSANYIQNQTASAQSASYRISGTSQAVSYQTTTFNSLTTFGISLDTFGSVIISVPTTYTGGWARGTSYTTAATTNIQASVGLYGSNTTAERLYMSFGATPWSGTGLFVTSANNVGIGTTAPVYKVDVQGSAIADSSVRVQGAFDINPLAGPPVIGGFTLSAGTSLGVGQYYYFVTYVTAVGETSAGAVLSVVTTSGNTTVNLTGIPVSADPRVTARKLYRTTLGQSSDAQKFLATISNNTTTTYVDSTPDASLTGNFLQYYKVNTTSRYITVSGVQGMVIDTNLTALGRSAGAQIIATNGAAVRTVLIGTSAGQNITTGSANVIVGVAGGLLTTGGSNALFGDLAGYGLTTGYTNTMLGGDGPGRFLITGYRNTIVGGGAGRFLYNGTTQFTTGADNTIIGANIRMLTASDTNSVVIGYDARGLGSNTVAIGNTSTILTSIPYGNLGVGTISPSQKLHVDGSAYITGALYDSTNSPGTSGQVLTSTATGTDWKSLSEITGVDGTGTANYVAKWSDTDTITAGIIYDNGTAIGIGTASPSAKLDIQGTSGGNIFLTKTVAGNQIFFVTDEGQVGIGKGAYNYKTINGVLDAALHIDNQFIYNTGGRTNTFAIDNSNFYRTFTAKDNGDVEIGYGLPYPAKSNLSVNGDLVIGTFTNTFGPPNTDASISTRGGFNFLRARYDPSMSLAGVELMNTYGTVIMGNSLTNSPFYNSYKLEVYNDAYIHGKLDANLDITLKGIPIESLMVAYSIALG
jgi:hypothetical protein